MSSTRTTDEMPPLISQIEDSSSTSRSPHAHSTDDKPRVLVLLASHNGSKWISEQIFSILAQKQVHVSILVRDDDSTDDTRDQLSQLISENSRVSLISNSTRTGSAARNFFSLIATTPADKFDYVALSDQDDIWFPDKIIRAISKLNERAGAGYSSATLAQWPDGKTRTISLKNPQSTADFLFEGAGQGCTFLITWNFYERARRFVVENPNLLSRVHFHDWTLYALARSWNLLWVFDPSPSMIYRQHHSNDTGARLSIKGLVKRLTLIRDGWYGEQLKAIASICVAANAEHPYVTEWTEALASPRGTLRALRLARFCITTGRRNTIDNAVLVLSCLIQWI